MAGERRSVLLTSILFIHLQVFVSSGSITKGVCPYLPPPTYCRDNSDLCNSDVDCATSQTNFKCCSNGCKKICAASVTERSEVPSSASSERTRPGNCPFLSVPKFCIAETNGCSNDFNCKDQFKCCSNGCAKRCYVATTRKAIDNGNAEQRNATCPHFPTNSSKCPRGSSDQCNSDSNCHDQGRSFKCCWDGCRKICLNPSEVQQTKGRSLCPFLRRNTRCTHFQHECISDSECRDGKICCSDGCTMKCVRPKANAEATSPPVPDNTAPAAHKIFRLDDKCPFIPRPSRCPLGALHQCYSNQECPKSLMCCSDGCRNICFDITKDISLLMCPIARRPKRCPENKQNFCTVNNDCGESGHKCCYDGCQFRCFGREGFVDVISDSPEVIRPLLSAAEVVFVLDTSNGPTLEEFELQKSFTTSLSRYFELGTNKVRVAIVTTDQNTRVVKYLSPYVTQADFESYMIRLYKQGGSRELSSAFEVIERDILSAARPNVPQIVIIFSFGLPTSSVWNLLTSVRSLHTSGVKVFAIGIDVQHDEPQLRALVYRPTDLFTFYSGSQLEHMEGVFAGHIASRADPEAVPENFNADLIFLLDSSRSVGRGNFTKVKRFVVSLSRLLNLEPRKTRVSLISFGDVVAQVSFNFERYNSISQLSNAMNWLVFLGGHARVERALEKVNELIGKARAGVRRIALMVTDRNYLAGETRPLEQTMLPLRNKGLEMVTLVVGGSQDDARRLAGLTTRPTDIFTASSYGDLPNLAPPIAKYIAHGPPPTTVRPTTTAAPSTEPQSTTRPEPKTPKPTRLPRQSTTYFVTPNVATQAPTTIRPKLKQQTSSKYRKYVAAGNRPTQQVLIKPGNCPPITRQSCQYPQRRCFTDKDCNADAKCCSDGCIVSCVKPVTNTNIQNAPSRQRPKAGICPTVSRVGISCPVADQCKTDDDCAGTKKCCLHYCRRLVCADPPSKAEERRLVNQLYRPGKCPILQKPDVCQASITIICNYDVDCSENKKCCSDGCQRRCVYAAGAPTPTRGGGGGGGGAGEVRTQAPTQGTRRPGIIAGRCPPYSPVKKCPVLVQDECTCSPDCASGLKCCFDGCKRICRNPAGGECSAKIDIVYLMDTSGSISVDDYRLEKQFVKDLARIFRIDVDKSHAAAIIYNDDPHVMIKLGDHRSTDDFAKAVDAIPYLRGRTRIDKALKAATGVFRNARNTVRKVLVVLTDGRQTQDPDAVPLDAASKPLKDMGVKIYSVGVGHSIDLQELRQIANDPRDVFTADSFTALLGQSQTVAARACGDVVEKICVRGVDLGFIVDSSESILDDDFVREKNAIKAISDEFVIAPENTRAGVVVYSGEPHVSIGFNQYTSNADFNRAVNALPHMQSHTRLDKALRYAASNLYNKRRANNPAIAIVMTDGKQTPGAESLTSAVQPLRDLGVRVFAVGVGPRVSQSELRELVKRYEDIYTVDSFAQLIEEAKKVTKRACPFPKPTIPPATTPAPFSTPSSTPSPNTYRYTQSPLRSLPPTPTPIQCSHFLDIIFIMDSSRSMDLREYDRQKDFVKRLAKIFNVGQGSRAAVIIYSDDPILSIDFEKYNTQKEFLDGVDALPYIMLRTRIDKALKMASQVLLDSRPGFPKIVIMMTDGRQTRDPDYVPLDQAAEPLHNAGARVLVIGIGPQISAAELMLMAKNPSDVFTVKSFNSLVHAASDVAGKSCQGPFPSIVPDTCSETFDLAFAMDSSGSMLISSYTKEKEFVKHVAGRLVVGPRQVMLGLLLFSNQPSVLVRFASQASVSLVSFDAAVDSAPYLRGRTRIDRALQAASTLFSGGRFGVPKVLVFLTDGRQSSDPGVTPLEEAVKPLIAQNVKIIVVGIGQEIDRRQLNILANGQGRDITQIGSFDDLDKLKKSFSQTICRRVEEVIQSGSP